MTTKPSHTPGPWRAGEHSGKPAVFTDAAPWMMVAKMGFTDEHTRPESEANARLIAAAPELRAIVEKQIRRAQLAFGAGQPIDPELEQAHALLARIDGQEP